VGDFNYHIDIVRNAGESQAKKRAASLLSQLETANFIQHVKGPTHKHGHTLDLVISRKSELGIRNMHCDMSVPSDHYAVIFDLSIPKPQRPRKEITVRNWKNMDMVSLKEDLRQSSLPITACSTVSEAVQKYNQGLTEVLEKHAPSSKRMITVRQDSPWFNTDIKMAKQKRRQLENKWRQSHLQFDREMYEAQRNLVNIKVEQAKLSYFSCTIKDAKNQKEVYKVTNKLLHKGKEIVLPSYTSTAELANRFAEYFTNKIVKIRTELEKDIKSHAENQVETTEDSKGKQKIISELTSFEPATENEILKLIKESPTKSCSQDPIPTWLLKECLEALLPVITLIVNLSLSTSTMPSELKEAHISPLIKKAILDSEILKNFRPVSNLAYLSKLIERVVAARFTAHLQTNNLHEDMQSAYRKYHSTETALLRVQNDILQAIDSQGAAILVLLDLSAAFDTIDHKILFSTVENEMGVTGNALAWFKSYLTDRHQSVIIDGMPSDKQKLQYGVPQGSVLGPLLFISYTKPLGDIIRRHGLQYHLYADDTQLYLAFRPTKTGTAQAVLNKIQICVK